MKILVSSRCSYFYQLFSSIYKNSNEAIFWVRNGYLRDYLDMWLMIDTNMITFGRDVFIKNSLSINVKIHVLPSERSNRRYISSHSYNYINYNYAVCIT